MRGSVIFQISWMKVAVQIAVMLLCTPDTVLGVPVMKTSTENITAAVGETVILPCQVQNLGNAKLNWFYVEHNTHISSGNAVLVSSVNKYSFVVPIDTSSTHLNLQITNIQISDTGHYRCYVDGKLVSVTHSLRVQGAPQLPDIVPPPANFTDCCMKRNVSSSCLPVCTPASVDTANFNPLGACALDLNNLLYCFSDNRNHAGCCRRRFVPDVCLDFCLDKPPTLTPDHMQCLNLSDKIISCFEEGQVLLPGPPSEVSVLPTSVSTILVNWKPPGMNPDTVTGYRVAHRLVPSESFMSTILLPANTSQWTLMGLQGYRQYEVYVTAVGQHGSSLPSARHTVLVSNLPTTPTQTIDIQGCCKEKGVSPWCRVNLCNSSTWTQPSPDAMYDCYAELSKIFHCLAGGRNHTPCCKSHAVPQPCLGLCSGSPPPLDWSQVECVLNMHTISACVQQGFIDLPSSPRFLVLKEVTNTTADLEWSPPTSGSAGVKNYLIQLREIRTQTKFTNLEQVTTNYIKLTNLKPSTTYEARVITVGDTASSLPSDSVRFLTYDTSYSTTLPPDTGIATLHNFSVCCANNKKISRQCYPACTYNLGALTAFLSNNTILCLDNLQDIITCASDGRNHIKCCDRREVSSSCQLFCNYTKNSPDLDLGHLTCLAHITSILECYEEGITYLPKHPVNVRVVRKTYNTMTVAWEKSPSGPSVDHYVVAYSPDLLSWKKFNVTATSYIIQNLKNNTAYSIEISSVNNNGTSPPSTRLTVRTKTGIVIQPPTINGTVVEGRVIWANRRECCKQHNVSQQCSPVCVGQRQGVASCIGDIASIFACISDGRDHRTCCRKKGIPEGCLSFCQGYHTGKNFISATCIAWTNIIANCSLEGADVVPSEPRNVSVQVVANNKVKVTWSPPALRCPPAFFNYTCTYQINYWRVSATDNMTAIDGPEATTVKNVTSPYILTSLTSFTRYRITVTAENQYGGSRHTEYQTVYMEFYGIQDLSIAQQPEGLIDQGNPVKLFCDAVANPRPTIVWKKDGKVVANGYKLAIKSVKASDSGLYTCEASNQNGRDSVTAFLPVKYTPTVVSHREASVEPKKGLTAILACWFDGFPDAATVKWIKDGTTVRASPPKIKEYREIRSHTGITSVQLRIYNVVGGDYGNYICKASNKYGTGTGAVKLIDPTAQVTPTPQPPKSRVTNVTACCIQKKVDTDCMVACTYDVDFHAIVNNPSLFKCAAYIPAYAQCAADGSDHTKCCKKKDVAEFCLPFCSGNLPDGTYEENILSNPDMFQCVNHADKIIDCMEENRDNIPNAPQVHAQLQNGNISVRWVPPTKNTYKVKQYLVYFRVAGKKEQFHAVSSSFTKYWIPVRQSKVTYQVWVVAVNDFGRSQPSNVFSVSVGGVSPNPPSNVDAEVVSSTKIRLRWSLPDSGPESSGFIIYYKKESDTGYKEIHTNSMSFRLEQLEPNSAYEAYLVSVNQHGESAPSRTIYFTTGGPVSAPHGSGDSGPSSQQIGLGIGLTLLVIAIIIVALLIFYVKFRRGKSAGPTETVSFENPSYGRNQVQISGLPADVMQPSNQFSYGRLEEDHITEKGEQGDGTYSTLNHDGHPEVNGNNPATLSVTTDEIHIQSPVKNESMT